MATRGGLEKELLVAVQQRDLGAVSRLLSGGAVHADGLIKFNRRPPTSQPEPKPDEDHGRVQTGTILPQHRRALRPAEPDLERGPADGLQASGSRRRLLLILCACMCIIRYSIYEKQDHGTLKSTL